MVMLKNGISIDLLEKNIYGHFVNLLVYKTFTTNSDGTVQPASYSMSHTEVRLD